MIIVMTTNERRGTTSAKNGVLYRPDGTVQSVRPPGEAKNEPIKNNGVYWSSGGGGTTGMTYTYKPMTYTSTNPSMWVGGGGGGSTYPFETDTTLDDYTYSPADMLDEHGLPIEVGGYLLLDDEFPELEEFDE